MLEPSPSMTTVKFERGHTSILADDSMILVDRRTKVWEILQDEEGVGRDNFEAVFGPL